MPVTQIATALGKATAPAALAMLRAVGKRKYDEVIALYTNALDSFLAASSHRVSEVKTLLNSENPVSISDIYVETIFDSSESSYSDGTLIRKLSQETGAYAVVGLAGSGKSMFMKYAANTLLNTILTHQRVPLFVEVRDLDFSDDDKNLDEMIFDYCVTSENKRNLEQFKFGLREGIFIVMLDGMDEAPSAKLELLLAKVNSFHQNYRQSVLIASVRPGTQLPNLNSFRVYKVAPMNIEQVVNVVEKAPFAQKRKTLLIDTLRGGLYQTHKSFLSNPLLVVIVLITFDDASSVPSHLTGFYAAAFDALFGRHDWSKGIYVRQHKTQLEKPAFESIFTSLCYLSYFYNDYTFEKGQIIDLIEKSIKHTQANVSSKDYLDDCVLAVCLLQIDEPKVIFVHRSFQEYFTAKFIANYSGPKLHNMLKWIVGRIHIDNTFLMIAQLNREALIRNWAFDLAKEKLSRWNEFIRLGKWYQVVEEAGIYKITVDHSIGHITVSYISWESGFGDISGIFVASEDSPSTVHTFGIETQLYDPKKYSSLPDSTKRLIGRTLKDSSVQITINEESDKLFKGLHFHKIAEEIVESLAHSVERMRGFLESKDAFAEMVDLALPSEVGAVIRN